MAIASNRQTALSPLRGARTLIVVSLMASVLSGCAIWPKALTWGSSEAEPEAAASVATPQTAAAGPVIAPALAVEEPKPPLPAPIPRSIADTVPLEPQPMTKAAPQATPPVDAPVSKAPASKNAKGKGKAGMSAAAEKESGAKAAAGKSASGEMVKGFYLNIGLFAVVSNGTNAFRALEQAEMPVFTDIVKSKRGPLTRVRVGPYLTKAQADAAAEKIKGMKLDAVVFQH